MPVSPSFASSPAARYSAATSPAAEYTAGQPVVAGPRLRRVALGLGSLFTVVTLAVVMFGLLANMAFDRNLHTTVFPSDDLGAVTTVAIDNSAGHVRVEGSTTSGVELETDVSDGLFRARHHERLDGDTLSLGASCPVGFATRCRVDHHLMVPSALALEVSGSRGAIDITGVDGDLDIDANFGPLAIVGGAGRMKIDHGFGSISGRGLASPIIEVSSIFGDTDLTFTTAPHLLEVTSRFGPVVIELPDDGAGYQITGTTEVGTRSIEVRSDPDSERRIHISSTFGDVTVRYAR